jgi:hypothetical protein
MPLLLLVLQQVIDQDDGIKTNASTGKRSDVDTSGEPTHAGSVAQRSATVTDVVGTITDDVKGKPIEIKAKNSATQSGTMAGVKDIEELHVVSSKDTSIIDVTALKIMVRYRNINTMYLDTRC